MRCFDRFRLAVEGYDRIERDPNPIISSPNNVTRLLKAIAFDHQIEIIWNSERTCNFKTCSGC